MGLIPGADDGNPPLPLRNSVAVGNLSITFYRCQTDIAILIVGIWSFPKHVEYLALKKGDS